MSAHLHDSVLQTLALIQRKAPENREVARLARRQERELRAWLNGGPPLVANNTFNSALIRAAEEVEDEHDVLVEVSTAGDRDLDERTTSVVLAAREAMNNAARFAGVDRIFVLSESREDGVRLVVRDQGSGFDPETVGSDRRGIRESIVGRLERAGGTATIRSVVGDGTEVELFMGEARPLS
jgi:signal transduction histidine kinase